MRGLLLFFASHISLYYLAVIFSSQFIIENIDKEYICSISYNNNENLSQNLEDKKPKTKSKDLKSKSFMKILEAKDKILLRQSN